MSEPKTSAGSAGEVSLGGEIAVHRLGFGAMRLTGEGIWGPPKAGKIAGEVLKRVAQARRASPTQVALAWLLRRSPIMLPIPGTSSIEHLEQNVAAAALRLPDAEYEALSAAQQARR